jgi:hypothetical protein
MDFQDFVDFANQRNTLAIMRARSADFRIRACQPQLRNPFACNFRVVHDYDVSLEIRCGQRGGKLDQKMIKLTQTQKLSFNLFWGPLANTSLYEFSELQCLFFIFCSTRRAAPTYLLQRNSWNFCPSKQVPGLSQDTLNIQPCEYSFFLVGAVGGGRSLPQPEV